MTKGPNQAALCSSASLIFCEAFEEVSKRSMLRYAFKALSESCPVKDIKSLTERTWREYMLVAKVRRAVCNVTNSFKDRF